MARLLASAGGGDLVEAAAVRVDRGLARNLAQPLDGGIDETGSISIVAHRRPA